MNALHITMVFATARKIIYVVFSIQIRNKDEHVPSLQHEDEFYWLENCQNSECMSDFLINERKVRVETVKAFFYRQNSHEIVFLVFLPTAASSQEAFCFSETENVKFCPTPLLKWDRYN